MSIFGFVFFFFYLTSLYHDEFKSCSRSEAVDLTNSLSPAVIISEPKYEPIANLSTSRQTRKAFIRVAEPDRYSLMSMRHKTRKSIVGMVSPAEEAINK